MRTAGIKRPAELPFPVHEGLAEDIEAMLAAMGRDDVFLGEYIDEASAESRALPEAQDDWVQAYYCQGGFWADLGEGGDRASASQGAPAHL